MNISRLLKTVVIICGLGLVAPLANAQPGNGNGNGGDVNRWVELLPTANSPSPYAVGRVAVTQTKKMELNDGASFVINVSNLPCRARQHSLEEHNTLPFEVYFLKINDEPMLSFNTRCHWLSRYETGGGEFYSTIHIHGSESLAGWLDDPRHDPIHAEVYLESPMSDPPTSTLVLEGWLVE